MSSPIMVSYYGKVQSFTYQQMQDGTFDSWMNQTYLNFSGVNPCQGLITTTTTTTSTNLVSNTLNLVMNLNTITNLDFSSLGKGIGTDIAGNTSSGSGSLEPGKNKKDDKSKSIDLKSDQKNQTSQNTGQTGDQTSQNTGQNGDQNGQNTGQNGQGSSSGSGQTGSGNSSGSGQGGQGSSGSSSGQGSGNPVNVEEPPKEKIEEIKEDQQKTNASGVSNAVNKSKTAGVQKPAILVTGDIVGVQSASSSSDQDARGTFSFTRVKGDGTSSISVSADYMINARIGNVTVVKSWIGQNSKGHKHINVLSDGMSLMPGTLSNTLLFVRVNSLKNFTALYGAAGSYGRMYGEELISTIAIGGFMYKGKLTKKVDATVIAALIYPPYTKYYTESFLESKPFVIPFLNLNYKMTKTFGIGLTGGGTYVAGQNVLNYQVLLGAKLLL